MSAVVLMYHRLGSGRVPGREAGEELYCVREEDFEASVESLAADGRTVMRPQALVTSALRRRGSLPRHAVALTFDDGNSSDLSLALPILQRHGFGAVFFVVPEWSEGAAKGYLDWNGVRELARAGMVIGAHGMDHQPLSTLPLPQLRAQLRESRELLEARLGEAPACISLPGGAGGRREVAAALEAGYRVVFGSVPRRLRSGQGGRPLPRFAVRLGDGVHRVISLQRHAPSALIRAWLRYALVTGARRVLGRTLYEGMRGRLSAALGDAVEG